MAASSELRQICEALAKVVRGEVSPSIFSKNDAKIILDTLNDLNAADRRAEELLLAATKVLSDANETRDALTDEIEDLKTERALLNTKIQDLEHEVEALRRDLREMTDTADSLEEDLATANVHIKDLEASIVHGRTGDEHVREVD